VPPDTPAPILTYSAPPRRRRWARRLVPAVILCLLVITGWHWRREMLRWVELQYFQRVCLRCQRPPEQVVALAGTPEDVTALAARDPAYVVESDGSTPVYAAQTVRQYDRLSELLEPQWRQGIFSFGSAKPRLPAAAPLVSTIFLHERTSPAGHIRLVEVIMCRCQHGTYWALWPTTYECGWRGPREIPRAESTDLATVESYPIGHRPVPAYNDMRFFAGQPDAADPSRFRIRYQVDGTPGWIDGRLLDDEGIEMIGTNSAPWMKNVGRVKIFAKRH
jgi:hypothetical protein